MQRKQMQTRNAQQSDHENGEAGSLRRKSSESNSWLKEGSTAPSGSPIRKSSEINDVKEGSTTPNFGDIDREEGSETPPYDGDGDDDGDGHGDGNQRSQRQRRSPNQLTYNCFGGLAGLWYFRKAHADLGNLLYEFLSTPSTILAAFYKRFQSLNFDSSLDTIEDDLPISLMVRALEKDDLTWAEARVSHEYGRFREAVLKEMQSLEEKDSREVVKRSSMKSKNSLPPT